MSLPPGVKFTPRGNFHPFVHPHGWTLSNMYKNGGDNITPRGQSSPLGTKFTPGDQLRP
jgi:hypothetical protein